MDLGLLRKKAIVYAAARHFYRRLQTDRFRERTVPTGYFDRVVSRQRVSDPWRCFRWTTSRATLHRIISPMA
jgi:hypothetical protein